MSDRIHESRPAFWTCRLLDLQASLGSNGGGLSTRAAEAARLTYGANVLHARRRRRLVLEYLSHFSNPLVLLLLGASAVSAALGDVTSFLVIAAIVVGSVTLEFVQEHRAGNAAARLRDSVALRASVWRDGRLTRLPASEVVPGDVVQLAAGDMVPADGRVLDARDFFVRQSMLTGESFPVEKHAVDLDVTDDDITQASNAAFMGSTVMSGSAKLLVCRIAEATVLGSIADVLRTPSAPTAFEVGTHRFGQLILRMTFGMTLFVIVVQMLAHRQFQETVMFAVALAVGLTPELLPMIVSITLARGAMRLSAQKVIVKRLAAIQNLGGMDVLCTDKTGTLTEATIRLERHVDLAGQDSPQVLRWAYLNSFFESGLRSPLDEAILKHDEVDVTGWCKVDEVPFGFERRRVSVLVARVGERRLIVKGAPEDMLPLCVQFECEEGASPRAMDGAAHARALAQFEALSREGFRVLAIAWRAVPAEHTRAVVSDEDELVLCGFAAFLDPPKAQAAHAIAQLQRHHVAIKVLTGDNEWVTRHVCEQVGLPVKKLLTGAQIEHLDESALVVQAACTDAFCRVSPAQKSRVLKALQSRGHVVGFLGDGVNDAPALHDADVGISVDSAVDVAKEAADLILLERDLSVLTQGVIEGRRTFANVMKYIMMATSSNFGNMFSMAAAALVLPFLPMLPVQILLNNLLGDIAQMPIPLDEVDAQYLRRPHDWDASFVRRFMWTLGPVSSLFDFLTFGLLLVVFQAHEGLFRTGWFIESIATQVLVIFVIRTRGRPWRSVPHRWLALCALTVVVLTVFLPFTPLAGFFGFQAPPARLLMMIAALTLAYLTCAELAKRWFYRTLPQRPRAHQRSEAHAASS